MAAPTLRLSTYLSPFVIVFALSVQPQQLKTINSPGGGTIVYGQVAGQTTEAGAMGAVLRSVHQNVGEKPQVGKLFQVHGTESVAVFFSATRRNGNGGQVAGIIIATKVSSDHVRSRTHHRRSNALPPDPSGKYEDFVRRMASSQGRCRFLGSFRKPAGSVAHPFTTSAGSTRPLRQCGPPRQLERSPPMPVAAATIVAVGPDRRERISRSRLPAMDTNNPAVSRPCVSFKLDVCRALNTHGRRTFLTAPMLAKNFRLPLQQGARPPAEILRPTSPSPPFHRCKATDVSDCAHLAGTVDFKDQKGTREMNGVYCVDPPGRMGTYMTLVYITTVPMSLAAKDRATLGAILENFNVNMGVVNAESA